MRTPKIITAIALCAGLAACGESIGEQALYGGGAGMLGAFVVEGDPIVGAAAGAAGNVLFCQQFPEKCG